MTEKQPQLPANYSAAKVALAQCAKIDEAKDYADRAQALAVYAAQAEDESLLNYARRIRARAVRRQGELLKEIEPAKGGKRGGGRPSKDGNQREGESPLVSRQAAAKAAGLSGDQQKTALRVANVPEDQFEQQVESDKPPSVTQLANQGRQPAPKVEPQRGPEPNGDATPHADQAKPAPPSVPQQSPAEQPREADPAKVEPSPEPFDTSKAAPIFVDHVTAPANNYKAWLETDPSPDTLEAARADIRKACDVLSEILGIQTARERAEQQVRRDAYEVERKAEEAERAANRAKGEAEEAALQKKLAEQEAKHNALKDRFRQIPLADLKPFHRLPNEDEDYFKLTDKEGLEAFLDEPVDDDIEEAIGDLLYEPIENEREAVKQAKREKRYKAEAKSPATVKAESRKQAERDAYKDAKADDPESAARLGMGRS
jgi:hypothetical protein